jgi:hypothetical protein
MWSVQERGIVREENDFGGAAGAVDYSGGTSDKLYI